MKKYVYALFSMLLLMLLASCGGNNINQKEAYGKIQNLVQGYSSDTVAFTAVLASEEKNIVLTNTGLLEKKDTDYTFSYSYQYLNEIGSGAKELITTEAGTIHGTKEEVLESGFEVSSSVSVVSLNLKDSFKTYRITEQEDSYSMKGYLVRNTIIKNTEYLDNDIRFNYELITNKDITKIEKLIISYGTVSFDSVIITITF